MLILGTYIFWTCSLLTGNHSEGQDLRCISQYQPIAIDDSTESSTVQSQAQVQVFCRDIIEFPPFVVQPKILAKCLVQAR